MPLIWRRGENPYKKNYFGILELGPNVRAEVIAAKCQDVLRKISGGAAHVVGEHPVTEAEVTEAESRLQDVRGRAAEVLLVHPDQTIASDKLRQMCRSIIERTTPVAGERLLRLTNLQALTPLLPTPSAEDLLWPEWEEFDVPGPKHLSERGLDVQFDL